MSEQAFKPAKNSKFTLKATLEGDKAPGSETKFGMRWADYLDEMLGYCSEEGSNINLTPIGKAQSKINNIKIRDEDSVYNALDLRGKIIRSCVVWNDKLVTDKFNSSNTKEVNVESFVHGFQFNDPKNDTEIFAAIRAEYWCLRGGEGALSGYKKVQSRSGRNGIDHLFVHGSEEISKSKPAYIVESKSSVTLGIDSTDPSEIGALVVSHLGKGRQEGTTGDDYKTVEYELYATQMNWEWIFKCLNELVKKSAGDKKRQNLIEKIRDIVKDNKKNNGDYIRRFVNLYGGEDTQQDSKLREMIEKNSIDSYEKRLASGKGLPARTVDEKIKLRQCKAAFNLKYPYMSYKNSVLRGDNGKALTGQAFLSALKKSNTHKLIMLNKDDGKWPEKDIDTQGHYHLLPGKYILGVNAEGMSQGNVDKPPTEILDSVAVGFANGDAYRDHEFVNLDDLPPELLKQIDDGNMSKYSRTKTGNRGKKIKTLDTSNARDNATQIKETNNIRSKN